MKVIRSELAREVWIITSKTRWSLINRSMKAELLAGIERLAALRERIGAEARVNVMPPVEVVCEIWMMPNDEGTIDGLSGVVQVDPAAPQFHFGVRLPALTAICADEPTVRSILVHEFSHCFFHSSLLIDHVDAGRPSEEFRLTDFDPFNADHDRERMVAPVEWFGEADVQDFLHHDDVGLEPVHQNLGRALAALPKKAHSHLPAKPIQIFIDDIVSAHIRSLRGQG